MATVIRKVEILVEKDFNTDESNAVTLAAVAVLNPRKLTFAIRLAPIPATAATSSRRDELLRIVSDLIDDAATEAKEEIQKYDPLYGKPTLFTQQPQENGEPQAAGEE